MSNYINNFSEDEKENKENIELNHEDPPMKLSDFCQKDNQKFQKESIYSVNKKVILIAHNKNNKKIQRGKSPFLITDKLCFRKTFSENENGNVFSVDNKKNNRKNHLGLCDYYAQRKIEKVIEDKKEKKAEIANTTPRFCDGR